MEVLLRNSTNYHLKKQVDYVLSNKQTNETGEFLLVRKGTPKILQLIGVPSCSIFMTKKHVITTSQTSGIYAGANYHGLGKELLYELPKLLETPALITESLSRPNSVILVTSRVDKEGRPIIIILHINRSVMVKSKIITANVLASVYGRNEWQYFIERVIKRNKFLFIDKEKSQHLLVTSGLQLPSCIAKFDSSIIVKKLSMIVNKGKR